MDHYIDLEVRANPEITPDQLMSALYAKLHRDLAGQGCKCIGVSFPQVSFQGVYLGPRIRLHGELDALNALSARNWLGSVRDHVTQSGPFKVPDNPGYRAVRRVQVKSNPARLRRRLMRRHDLTEVQACERIPDSSARFTKLPFVCLNSASTGQSYSLIIDHGALLSEPVVGEFNSYGLGTGATIPWF